MKKDQFSNLLYQLAAPVAVILVGLVLIVCPDTATVLISRLLGWALTLIGVGFGIAAIVNRRNAVTKGITAVLFACTGGWLTAHPLLLAAWIGRLLGLLIAARGVRDLFLSARLGYSRVLAVITTAVGLILVVLPMTTSRLVFSLCGVVVLALGIGMLLDRLKKQWFLPKGDDNIIDAL